MIVRRVVVCLRFVLCTSANFIIDYTLCLKNVTTLSCYNFNIGKPMLIIFRENVTEKERSQKVLFPPHLTSAPALPGEISKHKSHLFNQTLYSITVLPDFQQVAGLIYSVLQLTTHAQDAVWIPKAVVPCQNKIILKNFRPESPPSVDRPKIILFQHGTTSKIILKNFRLFQCFILTWNHVWNELKLF